MKEKLKISKLYGVAINDANYKTRITENYYKDGKRTSKDLWVCPYFLRWKQMLGRCYGKSTSSAYKDIKVCDEWLLFSNFKSWMETQDWEGMQLDKDLILKGNTLYSPEYCIFIPKEVNYFIIDHKKSEYCGTSFHKVIGKYQANLSNPFTGKNENLGYYSTRKEAHEAWKARKRSLANILVEQLPKNGTTIKMLLERYYA